MGIAQKNRPGCWTGLDLTLNWYADSLNFLTYEENLPNFLKNYLFDWQERDQLSRCLKNDEDASFRVAILSRVNNEQALNWIITSKNDYDSIYNPTVLREKLGRTDYYHHYSFPDLPDRTASWRDLARERLERIESIKKNIALPSKKR